MLKSIRLVNFYSFRDTTIELNQGVNVLVGINGSGKSNFLKVFELLNEAINGRRLRRYILEIGGVNEMLYQGERENDEIIIQLTFDGSVFEKEEDEDDEEFKGETYYQIKILPTQTEYYLEEKAWNDADKVYFYKEGEKVNVAAWFRSLKDTPLYHNGLELFMLSESFFTNTPMSGGGFVGLFNTLKSLAYITTINTTSKSPIRKPVLAIPETDIINGGDNLVQVLNTIKINDKKTYKKIIEALQRVNPYFKDFDFRPFGTNFEMLLEEEGLNRSIHLSKVSDGTLRYLCLITALLTNKKAVLCLDEPEIGLHPDMLFNIAQAIKEAGETATIIVSTHSAQLLNYFNLETVRVFEKDVDNSTQVYAYTEGDFKGWYETFQVGTMWRQGDIGGNRYGN
jgi:predicted ATPase